MDDEPIGLKEFDEDVPPSKFPKVFEIQRKLKSPLNVLWYNENTIWLDSYPAKFNKDFVRDMVTWYSDEGDLVWDCFNGSGVVGREALSQGRRFVGTDVNPKAIDLAQRHDPNHTDCYYVADVRKVKLKEKAKLVVCSPPFGISIAKDKNNYSEEVDDLSNSKSIQEFLKKMVDVWKNVFDNMAPCGILVFDARDRTKDAVYYDLIRHFVNAAELAGFVVHAKYTVFKMPWNLYTIHNKEDEKMIPAVSSIDSYVMYKPAITKLDSFQG